MRPTITVTIYKEILSKTSVGFFISKIVAIIREKIPKGETLFVQIKND